MTEFRQIVARRSSDEIVILSRSTRSASLWNPTPTTLTSSSNVSSRGTSDYDLVLRMTCCFHRNATSSCCIARGPMFGEQTRLWCCCHCAVLLRRVMRVVAIMDSIEQNQNEERGRSWTTTCALGPMTVAVRFSFFIRTNHDEAN